MATRVGALVEALRKIRMESGDEGCKCDAYRIARDALKAWDKDSPSVIAEGLVAALAKIGEQAREISELRAAVMSLNEKERGLREMLPILYGRDAVSLRSTPTADGTP